MSDTWFGFAYRQKSSGKVQILLRREKAKRRQVLENESILRWKAQDTRQSGIFVRMFLKISFYPRDYCVVNFLI